MSDPGLEHKDRESANSAFANGVSAQRPYWILARSAEMLDGTPYFTAGADTMVLAREASEVIPVFSFLEEAELFLWMGDFEGGWRVVEVHCTTLLEMLRGSYAGVDEIALDPIPEVQSRSFIGLVTVERERFVASLSGRDPDQLQAGPERP